MFWEFAEVLGTGAIQLGKAGLLSGKSATTHHDFLDRFAKAFPDVNVKRGLRLILQPLTENALRHGIGRRSGS